ncbi:hypothetical protein F5B21DRAFT_232649 [Xylaria acuta]|nr:hypothetical protein F5B21DRAFT_232649 [Xylaria acuta]
MLHRRQRNSLKCTGTKPMATLVLSYYSFIERGRPGHPTPSLSILLFILWAETIVWGLGALCSNKCPAMIKGQGPADRSATSFLTVEVQTSSELQYPRWGIAAEEPRVTSFAKRIDDALVETYTVWWISHGLVCCSGVGPLWTPPLRPFRAWTSAG